MPLPVDIAHEVSRLRERLAALERESAAIATRLAMLEQMSAVPSLTRPLEPAADRSQDATTSTPVATDITYLAVFRSLFHGREDVFPRRWENATIGKPAMPPPAATSGSAVSAASLPSSVGSVPTRPSSRSRMRSCRGTSRGRGSANRETSP
jgi:hypothetical protein